MERLCVQSCLHVTDARVLCQDGRSALMHAATHGHVECIALMVAQGVDVDAQNVVRVV